MDKLSVEKRYILALDQGTTSSRAILFDAAGMVCGLEQQEFSQIYPAPGWVEHSHEQIWESQINAATRLLRTRCVSPIEIAAIGITNQRETTLVWERTTGRPISNAIVWQDRRTSDRCSELRSQGVEPLVRARTGLPIDPYFSATKLEWILNSDPDVRERAESGELAFGTVDSYLVYRLSDGAVHRTDVSNASRTLLFNIHTGDWDEDLLDIFRIPRAILPEVLPSSAYFGATSIFGAPIPITGVAGDQQAAAFGQACHSLGSVKNTYGTGSFLLMNTGSTPHKSSCGLLTTVAWQLGHGVGSSAAPASEPEARGKSPTRQRDARPLCYALEGSVFVTGAAVQWLRDELQIIKSAGEIEALALSAPDSGGIYFVPAFTGLGTPYWDPYARGTILGLTRGVGRAQLARATLEAVCFQTADVVEAMRADSGIPLQELKVDGGMTVNNTLLQMQADILGIPVIRPTVTETTARGAAFLAGLAVGFWTDEQQIVKMWSADRVFEPAIGDDQRIERMQGWRRAVSHALNWATK